MRKFTLVLTVIATCILLVSAYRNPANILNGTVADYLLKYSAKEDSKSTYNFEVESNNVMNMQGREITTVMKIKGEILHNISSAENNKISHDLSYQNLDMKVNSSAAGDMKLDVSTLNGSSFIVNSKASGQGQILMNAKDYPAIQGSPLIEQYLLLAIPEFSEDKIKSGDTWKTIQNFEYDKKGVKLKTEQINNYTFAGIEKRFGIECAKCINNYTVSSVGTAVMGGREAEVIVEGTGKSEIYFAIDTGVLIEVINELKSITTMTLPALNNMTIVTNGEQKARLGFENK